jgi:DNA-binding MarR family transcriptional regulator
MTASEVADAAGLTRGAMTTALDRIGRAGYARRVRNKNDRRSVRVEMTDRALKEVEALYGPLAKEGGLRLQRYTDANWRPC